jgi:hypothetical protein
MQEGFSIRISGGKTWVEIMWLRIKNVCVAVLNLWVLIAGGNSFYKE